MEWFLQNWQFVLSCVFFVLGLIYAVVTFIRTGSIKKSVESFMEVNDLVKPMSLEQAQKSKPAPTKFSEYKDEYILNPSTNELEKLPTKVNIQQKIESYLDCALERALERLMPNVVGESEEVGENYQNSLQDLASLGEAMEVAEEWRDKLGLPDTFSMAQIYEAVDKQSKSLKAKLDSFNKPVDDKKEDKNDKT